MHTKQIDDHVRDIILENLPTFPECNPGHTRVVLPTMGELRDAANVIIGALKAHGYHIVKMEDPDGGTE